MQVHVQHWLYIVPVVKYPISYATEAQAVS